MLIYQILVMCTFSVCPLSQPGLHERCSLSGSLSLHQTFNNVNSIYSGGLPQNDGSLTVGTNMPPDRHKKVTRLTFLQGMLHWLVCWVSVHYQVAWQQRVGALQGREFYHHWRSPSRWSQMTTALNSERTTFSSKCRSCKWTISFPWATILAHWPHQSSQRRLHLADSREPSTW